MLALISCLSITVGFWADYEKKRLRRFHLSGREELPVAEVVDLFNYGNDYEASWIIEILHELSASTSTDIGMLRPSDRLGMEMKPIEGFEGFDRFDWLPKSVYEKMNENLRLEELVRLLWDEHST